MNALRRLRNALGLSQEEMAGFLKVSRSTVTKIESGTRMPSSALSDKILLLLKAAQGFQSAQETTPLPDQQFIEEYTYKLASAEIRQKELQQQHEQLLLRMHVIEELKGETLDDRTMKWLLMTEAETQAEMRGCDVHMRLKLQVEIEVYKEVMRRYGVG